MDYAHECPNCGTYTSEPYDDNGYCSSSCLPNEEELEEYYDHNYEA